jgi:hypothetical protein
VSRAAVLERFTLLFPLWSLLAAQALPSPLLFTWLQGPLIVLALVMLGMGLELELADFQRVLRRSGTPALGVAAPSASISPCESRASSMCRPAPVSRAPPSPSCLDNLGGSECRVDECAGVLVEAVDSKMTYTLQVNALLLSTD